MTHSLKQQITRPFWFLFAALFLIEAWLWDVLGGALKRLAALIPFESLKQALARWLDSLPAPVVLLVFLIPLGVIEPFKFLGLWLLANHHLFLGILAFLGAKFAGLGVMAFLFDVTREKLLSMQWFARFYDFVMRVRAWAHDLLEPYKQQIRAALAPYKEKLSEALASFRTEGRFGRMLHLLRLRVRRSRGLT